MHGIHLWSHTNSGKVDTKASVRLRRADQLVDVTTLRQPIKLIGVQQGVFRTTGNSKINDQLLSKSGKNVGYIKVKSFSSSTNAEVTKAMESFHDKGQQLDAIVIDLRNNGGGLLQGAVETSNLFLKPGKIVVFVVSKEGNVQAQQTLPSGIQSNDPELPDLTTPLYILVNGNTASAAEVFTASMMVRSDYRQFSTSLHNFDQHTTHLR